MIVKLLYSTERSASVDSETLLFLESSKTIMLYRDDDMKFNTHVNHILKNKTYTNLRLLYQNRRILNTQPKHSNVPHKLL